MKNILTSILILLLMASCSKDDDSSTTDNPETTRRFPKTTQILIPDSNGELVTFLKFDYGFNANKKIRSIEAEGFFGYENVYFTYATNGMPSEIEVQNTQGSKNYALQYTDNHLSGLTVDGQQIDISYNSSTNSYTFEKDGFTNTFSLNDKNDIRRFYSLNPNGSDTLMEMTFDTTKKGCFFNVDIPLNFFTAMVSDASTLLFTSHIPLVEVNDGGGTIDYQNQYDENGFITESYIVLGQDPTTVRFEYQEL